MSARLLLEVAIRVLGLWFVVVGIMGIVSLTSAFISPFSAPAVGLWYLLWPTVFYFLQGLAGLVLAWRAPWIAARFYSPQPEEQEIHLAVGPGDVYRIACFVLGVYLLVHASEPATKLVVSAMQAASLASRESIANAVTAIVYLVVGTVLVFGSRPVSQLLSNLRYDPDTIPRQQISLRVVLVVILAFAIILGLIRLMTRGGL